MAEYWNINSYDYYLPEEQIAQHPAEKRDESKLLVYSKNTKNITHSVFKNITEFLKPGDILVVNNCKVIPARIFAKRQDTGAEIELLLTREEKPGRWFALVKPGRKCKKGTKLVFGKIKAEVVEVDKTGQRIIEFFCSNDIFLKTLSEHGVIPLPPYIKRSHEPSSEEDRQRYQTVYAETGRAIAAPTAGFHFFKELFKKNKKKGFDIFFLTLNVGGGNF